MRKFNGIGRQHFHLFLKKSEWRFNNPSPQLPLPQLRVMGWKEFKLAIWYSPKFYLPCTP